MFRTACCILFLVAACNAGNVVIENHSGYDMWVGTQSNPGSELLANGGWQLNNGDSRTFGVSEQWAGRFWGRTNCDASTGHCETGDCGKGLECGGNGGTPPTTLAEIRFKGDAGKDYYDISLVNGFNVPMTIAPTSGGCKVGSCTADVNANCPGDLQVKNGDGQVIACQASCDVSCQTSCNPDYCCSDAAHNSAATCSGGESAKYFKGKCPDAYSYAYDDNSSLYTCENTDYKITFGS